MSPCDVYRLQSLVDGDLPDSEADELRTHLGSCAACSHMLDMLRLVSEPLRDVSDCVPDSLQETLLAAVAGMQPLPALSCERALELVSARLDGELSHAECQHLAAHLDGCAACHKAAGQSEITAGLLRSIAAEAPPAGLLERIQAATELAAPPEHTAVQWRRWVPSFAGVAAAAALVVALLSGSPQTPNIPPSITQAPAVERVMTTLPPVAPVRAPATAARRTSAPPTVAASAAPARALAYQRPKSTVVAVAPIASRPQQSASSAVAPLRRDYATPAASVPMPGSPAVVPEPEIRQPMAVAVAPSRTPRPEVVPEVAVTAIPHADTPPAPAARLPETPRPVRVATSDGPKATPTATQPRRTVQKRQRTWVSRADDEERELYTSDDAGTRLADARDRLDRDIRHIVDNEVKGFVIH